MKITEIVKSSILIRDYLKKFEDFPENPIDENLLPVPPYKASSDIRLIIIGQDPTIKDINQRNKIEFALNLDKPGSLRTYITTICKKLGVDYINIYGTNLFKYFYKNPPAGTLQILRNHLLPNLYLLRTEIENYPKAKIITLGEPVLKLLVKDECPSEMTFYWDYNPKTKKSKQDFKFCGKEENHLGKDFFTLPHQPSLVKEFYSNTLDTYLNYINSHIYQK